MKEIVSCKGRHTDATKDVHLDRHEEGSSLPDILIVPDVARYLRISRSAAYELVHEPDFPAIIRGRKIRIRRESFLPWLVEQENTKAKANSLTGPGREH